MLIIYFIHLLKIKKKKKNDFWSRKINKNFNPYIDLFYLEVCTYRICLTMYWALLELEPIILESYITNHYSILLIDKGNIKNNNEVHNIKLLSNFLTKEKWETILNELVVDICANKFHNLLNNYILLIQVST